MSHAALRPSLADMPPELLRYTFSPQRAQDGDWASLLNEHVGEDDEAGVGETSQETKEEGEDGNEERVGEDGEPDERGETEGSLGQKLLLLRSLSHTCRSLRSFALPLLWDHRRWKAMQVNGVRDLGQVRDALRLMPHLGASVEEFNFMWWLGMDEDDEDADEEDKCGSYSAEHGSLLDMAFVDRVALWNRTREELGAHQLQGYPSYFEHNGLRYYQPHAARDSGSTNVQQSGPAGRGEDPRIKNAKDFSDCCTEVFSQLTSLSCFRWDCKVSPIPAGAFEALKKLPGLKVLQTNLWYQRSFQHLPLWELASNLEELTLYQISEQDSYDDEHWCKDSVGVDFVTDEEIAAFTVPSEPRVGDDKLIIATAWRTIATAARGMRLKDLTVRHGHALWKPFAVPTLLPAWVGIQQWYNRAEWLYWDFDLNWHEHESGMWVTAATMLRYALYHMSILPLSEREARPNATNSRLLTCGDAQAMRDEFKSNPLPQISEPHWALGFGLVEITATQRLVEGSTIDRYFAWLQGAELAQQVADAWNNVVQRGDADHRKCSCSKCLPLDASPP